MSAPPPALVAWALQGIPLVQQGDDLVTLLMDGLSTARLTLLPGDVIVVASKVVSKAEGRLVRLADVTVTADAEHYAVQTGKDARLVTLVLAESVEVVRAAPGVLVTEHRLGFVSANAGIDQSNVEGGDEVALLLPPAPDATAAALRAEIGARTGVDVAVVISDTHGRPFRMGNVGVALGASGVPALLDLRGEADLYGRALKISLLGYGDLLACAAHLLSGEAGEGRPFVLMRGALLRGEGQASALHRPKSQDMFRQGP